MLVVVFLDILNHWMEHSEGEEYTRILYLNKALT